MPWNRTSRENYPPACAVCVAAAAEVAERGMAGTSWQVGDASQAERVACRTATAVANGPESGGVAIIGAGAGVTSWQVGEASQAASVATWNLAAVAKRLPAEWVLVTTTAGALVEEENAGGWKSVT